MKTTLKIMIIYCHVAVFSQGIIALDPNQYIVKDISYDYDLISGKVNQVYYQKGQEDQLIHKYSYDGDNRITQVHTSTNGVDWTSDAKYEYYAHGPLAKTDLGEFNVETNVYAYTLQGWIKGVQGHSFSYALGYHGKDYKGINATAYGGEQVGMKATPIANNASGKSTGLYNGNIATWATNTPALAVRDVADMTNQYSYDQLNRIKSSIVFGRADQYRTKYSYDANGNITSLQRYTGTKDKNLNSIVPQLMDNFQYNYESKGAGYLANTNKLRNVDDAVKGQMSPTLKAEDLSAEDLEDQDIDNYQYDDIGNLNYDRQEEIDRIEWNVYRKIKAVYRKQESLKPNLVFEYDASGNRVSKTSIKGADVRKTLYIRDASCNVMGTYESAGTSSLSLSEQHLYGSARLGMLDNEGRSYEIVDHLGNVRTVVNDLKEMKAAYEYFAFGMSLAKVDNGYRYGFNGKENDSETGWQDYGMRMYNPTLSRFFSVDPIKDQYPWLTPYQFASNNPIAGVDRDGLEFTTYLDRAKVEARINVLTKDPIQIDQGGAGTCVIASATYLWILRDSKGFAEAAMKLYEDGQVKVNNYNIDPDDDLQKNNPVKNPNVSKGALADDRQADWMILSSIQDSQNSFLDFEGNDNEDWSDGNDLDDKIDLMKNLVGYKNVSSEEFDGMAGGDILNKLVTKSNEGNGIMLGIDAHVIDPKLYEKGSYHCVSFIKGSYSSTKDAKGVVTHSFKIQTWGGEVTIIGTDAQLKDNIRNAVYGNDNEEKTKTTTE